MDPDAVRRFREGLRFAFLTARDAYLVDPEGYVDDDLDLVVLADVICMVMEVSERHPEWAGRWLKALRASGFRAYGHDFEETMNNNAILLTSIMPAPDL